MDFGVGQQCLTLGEVIIAGDTSRESLISICMVSIQTE